MDVDESSPFEQVSLLLLNRSNNYFNRVSAMQSLIKVPLRANNPENASVIFFVEPARRRRARIVWHF